MTPSRLIDLYLVMRSSRTAPPSPTGFQLDKLRLNLPRGTGGDAEEQLSFFAHLAYAVEQLSDEERRVVFAMRTPSGTKPYRREVRDGDLFVRERDRGDGTVERVQETAAGEVFAGPSRPGWVVVEGHRPVYPTREQVAERLGLTFQRVKSVIRSAYGKLEIDE